MNVHNLFPGVIADPNNRSASKVLSDLDMDHVDMMVMLVVKEVAGRWDVNIHSAGMGNAEILLALELMKKNILERMTYA